jgi:hypothetical protein
MTLRRALLAGAAVAGGAVIAAMIATTAPTVATASGSNTVFVAGGSIGGSGPPSLAGAGLGETGFGGLDTVILASGMTGGTGVGASVERLTLA